MRTDTPAPHAAARLRAAVRILTTPSPDHSPLLGSASRRWQRLIPYGAAVALIASLLPTGINVLTGDYHLNGAVAAALAVAQSAPLLLAVTRPLQAWWIIAAADVLTALLMLGGTPAGRSWPWYPPGIIGYLFLMLALALRENRRTLTAVWLTTAAGSLLVDLAAPALGGTGVNILVLSLTGSVLLLGGALRERAEAQRRLAEQEHISEAERARRTLLEERTRIARELHDVVAHHMSVITVQADSAPYRIAGLPDAAREEFAAIGAAARESLAEMRRLLGVLRSEDTAGERAPQPGLDRLPQLVETVARAGVPAELALSDPARALGPLPQAVDLSAYRIVQEALANVVRHAPGARTWVSVTTTGAPHAPELRVTVVNGAPPHRPAPVEHPSDGTGQGLVGMRERLRLLDGRLDAGPLPDGGFRIAAVIPLGTPPGAAPPAATDDHRTEEPAP